MTSAWSRSPPPPPAASFCWSSTPGGREPFLRLGSSEKPLERRDHDGCDHAAAPHREGSAPARRVRASARTRASARRNGRRRGDAVRLAQAVRAGQQLRRRQPAVGPPRAPAAPRFPGGPLRRCPRASDHAAALAWGTLLRRRAARAPGKPPRFSPSAPSSGRCFSPMPWWRPTTGSLQTVQNGPFAACIPIPKPAPPPGRIDEHDERRGYEQAHDECRELGGTDVSCRRRKGQVCRTRAHRPRRCHGPRFARSRPGARSRTTKSLRSRGRPGARGLRLPTNPNGRTNADVLKPWINGNGPDPATGGEVDRRLRVDDVRRRRGAVRRAAQRSSGEPPAAR